MNSGRAFHELRLVNPGMDVTRSTNSNGVRSTDINIMYERRVYRKV